MKRQHLTVIAMVAVACGYPAFSVAQPNPVPITLNSTNSTFNESGTATLTPTFPNKTTVSITLSNVPSGETQYVFFQYGTCDNLFFDVVYPLNDLVNGTSTSIYDVGTQDLLAVGPMDGGGADKGTETPPPTATPAAVTTSGPHGHFNPHFSQKPTSFAVAIWRYTTSGKTLVSCGDRKLTGQPNFIHFQ